MVRLSGLLRPGCLLMLTIRQGPAAPDRAMHPASAEEVVSLAQDAGLVPLRRQDVPDAHRRPGVSWSYVALRRRT